MAHSRKIQPKRPLRYSRVHGMGSEETDNRSQISRESSRTPRSHETRHEGHRSKQEFFKPEMALNLPPLEARRIYL